MKVAVYTLTRDRLEYTRYCFYVLNQRAGCPYDHFIIDQGSADGTREWLTENRLAFRDVTLLNENIGISAGSNMAIEHILKIGGYDLVIKFDNDCEVVSGNIISQMAEIFQDAKKQRFAPQYALSPRVEGIVNQPTRGRYTQLAGRRIGLTGIIGGLFMAAPAEVFKAYKYDEALPLAWGQDDTFCKWFKEKGGEVGYVEGLIVNHFETTDGQAKRFPEYFRRKWDEEKSGVGKA